MKSKLFLGAGFIAGYVAGTKAGRARYDQIVHWANAVVRWGSARFDDLSAEERAGLGGEVVRRLQRFSGEEALHPSVGKISARPTA